MKTSIAIDLGRSAAKLVAYDGANDRREMLLYPSAVIPAKPLSDEGARARAMGETVTVNTKSYYFGDTAIRQGHDDLLGGLRDDWFATDHHRALFLGGLKKLTEAGVPDVDSALIIVGLPSSMYASHKAQLAKVLSALAPQATIKVMPQALGPYFALAFDEKGQETERIEASGMYGAIEVGQYTTDYALVIEGDPIDDAYGSCSGMSKVAASLQRILQQKDYSVTLAEATQALATKQIKNFGKVVDVWTEVTAAVEPLAEEIYMKSREVFGSYLRKLDKIVLAGGGAGLVAPRLSSEWGTLELVPNERFAVAEGFLRYALAMTTIPEQRGKSGFLGQLFRIA
ncbi:plasmid segregation protein ParM [Paraburkholderia sp. EB58]|jgi:plasmid segregation protein ParM|uniref:ParM/StbA family protein n=1 Tax=Paraburkholderia sp. EB58 TaxID=3035125 RepID=UPI003D21EA94